MTGKPAYIRHYDHRRVDPCKQRFQACPGKPACDAGTEQHQWGLLACSSQYCIQLVPVRYTHLQSRQTVTAGADFIADKDRK